jgi:hypothetical protein
MELVKKGGVKVEEKKPLGPPLKGPLYKCPMDGGTRDTPGPCPKCGMALDERHKVAPEAPAAERKVYVCDVHPEEVFDKPGRCKKES